MKKSLCFIIILCLIFSVIMAPSVSARFSIPKAVEEKADFSLLFSGEIKEKPVYGLYWKETDKIKIKIYYCGEEHTDILRAQNLYITDVEKLIINKNIEDFPLEAILAQAFTEGGAGRVGIYSATNNMFGMMAGPGYKGYVYSQTTGLIYDSYATARAYGASGLFRAYPSMEDSLDDYLTMIRESDRYADGLGKDARTYLQNLVENGYGEKEMVEKWMSLIQMFGLNETEHKINVIRQNTAEAQVRNSLIHKIIKKLRILSIIPTNYVCGYCLKETEDASRIDDVIFEILKNKNVLTNRYICDECKEKLKNSILF